VALVVGRITATAASYENRESDDSDSSHLTRPASIEDAELRRRKMQERRQRFRTRERSV
jgi:hypothetical protein